MREGEAGKTSPSMGGLVDLLLGTDHEEDDGGGAHHDEDADDGIHPIASGTGARQIEATGVDHFERGKSIEGFTVLVHVHVVAVHGRGGGQQTMLQMLLDVGVAIVVLDNTQHIVVIPVTEVALGGGDNHLDIVLQQGIAVVGLGLGDGIGIILQTTDEDLTGVGGNEVRGVRLGLDVIGHIVETVVAEDCLNVVVVLIVVHQELDMGEIAVAVRELLGQINTEAEQMAVIVKLVGIGLIAAAPDELDAVGVAIVAVYHGGIRVERGIVGDAHGAVGITAVHHGAAGVHEAVAVDLLEPLGGHADGHDRSTVLAGAVGHGELGNAVALLPGGNEVRAFLIGEELDHHIVTVVGDSHGQRVNKGVLREIGSLGGNGRQSADDLIVNGIEAGCGSGMCVAVVDLGAGAGVVAGVGHVFAERLLQRGNTG